MISNTTWFVAACRGSSGFFSYCFLFFSNLFSVSSSFPSFLSVLIPSLLLRIIEFHLFMWCYNYSAFYFWFPYVLSFLVPKLCTYRGFILFDLSLPPYSSTNDVLFHFSSASLHITCLYNCYNMYNLLNHLFTFHSLTFYHFFSSFPFFNFYI